MPEPTLHDRFAGSPALRRYQARPRRLVRALARVYVEGHANVLAGGPVGLAVNHRSMLDGPLVFGFVERPDTCLVKAEAFTPRMTAILHNCGQLPVVRGAVDPRPVKLGDVPVACTGTSAPTERIRAVLTGHVTAVLAGAAPTPSTVQEDA
jgi:1-acyl-sn-glycerol-3-phosphate acyltransferase